MTDPQPEDHLGILFVRATVAALAGLPIERVPYWRADPAGFLRALKQQRPRPLRGEGEARSEQSHRRS